MANFFDDPVEVGPPAPELTLPVDTTQQGPLNPQPPPAGNFFDDKPGVPGTGAIPPGPPVPVEEKREPNQPFGELKPYTPSWSEWLIGKGQDALMALGADPYRARHLSSGMLDVASLFPPIGAARAGADTAFYEGQGQYGKAATSALGLIPAGKMGEVLRGVPPSLPEVLPPNFADASAPAPRPAFVPAPSSEQQLGAGSAGYREWRSGPQTYSPQFTRDLVADTRSTLDAAGMPAANTTHVDSALETLERKANTQPAITRQDLNTFRASLSHAKTKAEAPEAMTAQTVLYDKEAQTGSDTLRRATENYGAGMRTQKVEQILANSERAANPDVALGSKLRSEVQKLDVRPRGYTDQEVDMLDAARGAGSTRDRIGNFLLKYGTAPSVLTTAGMSGGAMLGLVDPAVALKSAVLPAMTGGAGAALKMSAAEARRAATQEAADLVARRSPLYREAVSGNLADQLFTPGTIQQRNAIARQLLSQPQPLPSYEEQ